MGSVGCWQMIATRMLQKKKKKNANMSLSQWHHHGINENYLSNGKLSNLRLRYDGYFIMATL